MQTYIILRRSAWESSEDLDEAAAQSIQVADDDMDGRIRWIRSYVIEEEDGMLGTVCVYQAEDEEAILEHANRAELPADEIMPVADTVIVRDDP
jgi:thiamine biosynthesis protein ThiC